ncbi:hypothetical protein QLQ12_26840 [Actinoplanes sp. NEAU-A12]|uniref:Uncharacterized protein n=1 Tax=Actinoplanes sandaracinus TaxID=3045177 RepID=A0ABT6WR84_9ACTN|nr:hypothetical protein [Actinoplanes sandaracinus]MDI6102240.1 hypothetical protein [Actinoplanes sandaracinus]
MPERRHYPPMMTFHAPDCPGLAPMRDGFISLPLNEARIKYPNHHLDVCAAIDITPYVVVEKSMGDHGYSPSGTRPEDAIRSLCRKCFGTHGEDEDREVITVKTQPKPRLTLPPGAERP